MNKAHAILAGLAALQLVLLLVLGGDRAVSTEGVSEPGVKPFDGITLDRIGRFEITDEDDANIVIARQEGDGEDGGTSWGVASVGGFPVRDDKPAKLLEDLRKTTLGRVLTKRASNLARLEVADERFARHVVIKDTDGGTVADFYIGEGDRYDEVNFRRAGESIAYHATGLATFDFGADVASWIETGFTDYEAKKVGKVELARDGDLLVIEKRTREKPAPPKEEGGAAEEGAEPGKQEPEKEDYWVVVSPETEAGRELDKAKAESLVRGLSRLYLATAIGKVGDGGDHGFDAPTATATLHLAGEDAPAVVTIGRQREEEKDYFARRSGFDYVVTLRSYSIDDYFKKPLKDLLPEEKTPEDEGAK